VVVVLLCFGVCAMGLQQGVERITKVMMVCLLGLMVVLAVHSMILPGGGPGLEFYLKPDFGKMKEAGLGERETGSTTLVLFYAEHWNWSLGYLWKLYRQRAVPDRGGGQRRAFRYHGCIHGRPYYFPGMFCLSD
jgi:hypothetical protein